MAADLCSAKATASGFAEPMLATVDCFVRTTVQSGYGALLGANSSFNTMLTAALTLYVAFVGLQLMLGRTTLALTELTPRILVIGAVLSLATNWAAYQTLVFATLTDGPQEIARMVAPADQGAPLMARVDTVAQALVDVADAWTEADRAAPPVAPAATPPAGAPASATPPAPATAAMPFAPRGSLGPDLLLASAALLVLASAGVIVVAKALLGLLLAVGPLFVVLALFGHTRGLAMGWARVSVLLAIVPLFAALTTAGGLALIEPVVTSLMVAARQDVFELRPALLLFTEAVLIAAVAVTLFRIATQITSTWTADLRRRRSDGATASAVAPMPVAMPAPARGDVLRIEAMTAGLGRAASVAGSSALAWHSRRPAESLAGSVPAPAYRKAPEPVRRDLPGVRGGARAPLRSARERG